MSDGTRRAKEDEDGPAELRCSYSMGPENPREPLSNNAAVFMV